MKQSELYAYIGTAISAIIILLILLFVFLPGLNVEGDGGVMISFGEVYDGGGSTTEYSQEQSTIANTPKPDVKEDILTQEDESVPIPDTKKSDQKPSKEEEKRKHEEERRKKEEEAAKKSEDLVGSAFNSATTSGSGQTTGDKAAGNPVSSTTTKEGHSFSLDGRDLFDGTMPTPNYSQNVEGIVVVEITVDASGKVISATIANRGNTIMDQSIRDAAINAAKRTKFTKGDGITKGTITYNFNLT